MRKDFSQEFTSGDSIAYFIVKDSKTGLYLMWHSNDYYSGVVNTPHTTIDLKNSISLQLAKYFYSEKLLLNSYRTLSSRIDLSFSFIDETLGSESTDTCYLVECDILSMDPKTIADGTYVPSLVPLAELHAELLNSKYYPVVLREGIATILNEQGIAQKP